MSRRERPRRWRLPLIAAAVAVVAAGAMVWRTYRQDIGAAKSRVEGRSTVINSPYGVIEYASVGAGTPVLAIHGSGGGFDQGLEMMGPLAERGYRLIAPSRFGYLRSGRPANASPEVQADALAWLMRHLGEEKVIVAGGSAGALPALQFALRHPELTQAVVLLVPASFAPGRAANENAMGGPVGERIVFGLLGSDFFFWAASRMMPDKMTRALLATDPALLRDASAQEQQRVRQILDHILPVSRRAMGLRDDSRWAGVPPPYPIERITAPLLALSFEDDLYGTHAAAEYTAAKAPRGRMAGFPSGGHVWVGRVEEVWNTVATFLMEIDDVADMR